MYAPFSPAPAAAVFAPAGDVGYRAPPAFGASTRLTDDAVDLSTAHLDMLRFQSATLTPVIADANPYRTAAPLVRGLPGHSGGNAGPGLGPRAAGATAELQWSAGQARAAGAKLPKGLNPRPLGATVPYMGRGSVNIAEDDAVRRGEYVLFPDGQRQQTRLFLREPARRAPDGPRDSYNNPDSVPQIPDHPRLPAPVNTLRGGASSRAEYATVQTGSK